MYHFDCHIWYAHHEYQRLFRMETKELSKLRKLEKAFIHPSIKTDLANPENHPSTKSHSRSYSHNHTVGVGLIDENRPKPMNSASKWYSLSLISSLSSLLSCSSINIYYDHHHHHHHHPSHPHHPSPLKDDNYEDDMDMMIINMIEQIINYAVGNHHYLTLTSLYEWFSRDFKCLLK